MISTQMNEFDFEEKRLLHSLHHTTIQQPLNLPGPNDDISTDYQYRRSQYIASERSYHRYNNYDRNNHRMEPIPFDEIQNKTHHRGPSTVSMTTDEDLDNFELNFETNEADIEGSGHSNTSDMEPIDTATIVTETNHTDHKSCLVTPDLPRNISMDKVTKPKSPKRKSKDTKGKPIRVETPTPQDVLCGQSRVCASHPGNRTFQQVLEDFAHKYDNATSKQEKMTMTKAVVSILHESGGRFLKFKDGMWEEISTVAARDKVSHALRTKVSSWKRQHHQLLQQQKDVFHPRRTSLSRTSRKRSHPEDSADPIPLDRAESTSKVNDLLQSQQAFFAQLNKASPSPRSSKSNHHVRHSFGGHHSRNDQYNHSRRSSSTF